MPESYSPTATPPRPTTAQAVDTAGCVDPARVSPLHLPALGHVAADLDGLGAPVRIVNPTDLGDCAACPDGDLPEPGAIATVVSTDADGFRYRDPVCALHLRPEVGYHARSGHTVVVDVPATGGRRWFERTDRETFYGIDESRGIDVARYFHDTWTIVEIAQEGDVWSSVAELCVIGLRDGESFDQARLRAELLAQAVAAVRAADAYELGYAVAEAAAKALFPTPSGTGAAA